MTRPFTKVTRYATYRVKGTCYPAGRTYTHLFPANTAGEAENAFRRRHPAKDGYRFQTKRVADHWRERD